MYPASAGFQSKILSTDRTFKLSVTIDHSGGTLNLTDADVALGSLSVIEKSQPTDEFSVGGVVASDLSIEILNKTGYDIINFTGAVVKPVVSLLTNSAPETWENVPLGVFNVDEPSKMKNTTKLKAIDNMIKLDKPYSASTLAYPATLLQIYTDICTICGVSPAVGSFTNSAHVVAEKPEGDYSCRDIISAVAALCGAFARMNRAGALEFVWYAATAVTLTGANRFDFKPMDTVLNITGVLATVDDTTYLAGTEVYAVDLSDNPLLQSGYDTILPVIFNKIKVVSFHPFTSSWQGNPAMQAGDIITQTGTNGVVYPTVVTSTTYKYRGRSVFEAKGLPNVSRGFQGTTSKKLSTLLKQVRENNANVLGELTSLEQAQLNATELMGNMLGGYVIKDEQNGVLYIADNPDLELAVKVWKWGIGGFGYSSTGVNGVYTTAITADGSIVTMLLAANIITADMITIGAGSTFEAGYDPSTKATQLALNNLQTDVTNFSSDLKLTLAEANALENNLTQVKSESTKLLDMGKLFGSDFTVLGKTAQNIVTNGNFVNTTGWNAANSTISASGNILSITGSGASNSPLANRSVGSFKIGGKIFVKAKLRVTNAVCTSLSISIDGTTAGTEQYAAQATPAQNTWYNVSAVLTVPVDFTGNLEVKLRHNYVDGATANGKVMEVQEVMCIDMTASGESALTAAQMNTKYPLYFDGVAHGEPITLRSVGKNLFDMSNFTTLQMNPPVSGGVGRYIPLKLKPNTTYTVKTILDKLGSVAVADYYGWISTNLLSNYTGTTIFNWNTNVGYTKQFTTDGASQYYFMVYKSGAPSLVPELNLVLKAFQLEQNTVATAYEPYQHAETTTPTTLRSLPNAVKDEYDVATGKLTQKVQEYTLVAGDVTVLIGATNVDYAVVSYANMSDYLYKLKQETDASSISTSRTSPRRNVSNNDASLTWLHWNQGTGLFLIIPRGTYANLAAAQTALAGTKICYQLATPVVTQHAIQVLPTYPSGTVYVEITGNSTSPDYTLAYRTPITAYDAAITALNTELVTKWIGQATYPKDILQADRTAIDGKFSTVQSTKSTLFDFITKGYQNLAQRDATTKVSALQSSLGSLAYQSLVETAMLGNTIIEGGYLKTVLLEAHSIGAEKLAVDELSAISANLGAVKLGGLNNINGRLTAFNAAGEVIADLDAGKGGFEELQIGKVVSSSIVGVDMLGTRSLFVDASTGDDATGTGTAGGTPFKTFQAAVNSLPKFLPYIVTIYATANQTHNGGLIIEGFMGPGKIWISFKSGTLVGQLLVFNCICQIDIYFGDTSSTRGKQVINSAPADASAAIMNRSVNTNVYNLEQYCNGYVNYGVGCWFGHLWVDNIVFYGLTGKTGVMVASYGGVIWSVNCTGEQTLYGPVAYATGRIAAQGTMPGGSVANGLASNGGVITGSPTYPAPPTPLTPPTVPTTKVWSATDLTQWRYTTANVWDTYPNYMMQSYYEGASNYPWTGLAYFDLTSIRASIDGKTVTGCRVRLKRRSSGGYSAARTVYGFAHAMTTTTGGVTRYDSMGALGTLAWGEDKWFNLPVSFANSLKTGGGRTGFAIYDTNSQNYMYVELCQLEITYNA